MPAGEVAAADIGDFAVADECLHRLPDLVPRCEAIDMMHLVEVDVIGLEPAQARLTRATNVISGQAPVIWPGVHRLIDLGREHDPLATATALSEPTADDIF